jgi:hypothetical protein
MPDNATRMPIPVLSVLSCVYRKTAFLIVFQTKLERFLACFFFVDGVPWDSIQLGDCRIQFATVYRADAILDEAH